MAHRAYGSGRLLIELHGDLEDLEGAVRAGQFLYAAYQARTVLEWALSIRSLALGGSIATVAGAIVDLSSFDLLENLDPEVVADAVDLVHDGLALTGATDALDWARRVRAFVEETEAGLLHDAPLASIRTGDGMFPALRMARSIDVVLARLALPSVLPEQWTSGSEQASGETRARR
jgi:hypothetical protein